MYVSSKALAFYGVATNILCIYKYTSYYYYTVRYYYYTILYYCYTILLLYCYWLQSICRLVVILLEIEILARGSSGVQRIGQPQPLKGGGSATGGGAAAAPPTSRPTPSVPAPRSTLNGTAAGMTFLLFYLKVVLVLDFFRG